MVPIFAVGSILGRGGAIIKQLMQASGAKIHLQNKAELMASGGRVAHPTASQRAPPSSLRALLLFLRCARAAPRDRAVVGAASTDGCMDISALGVLTTLCSCLTLSFFSALSGNRTNHEGSLTPNPRSLLARRTSPSTPQTLIAGGTTSRRRVLRIHALRARAHVAPIHSRGSWSAGWTSVARPNS